MPCPSFHSFFFFFNDTATTEIYTLSLHDALPIYRGIEREAVHALPRRVHEHRAGAVQDVAGGDLGDRKSTRLNSSHSQISYAVFCLKKKNQPRSVGQPQDHSNGHFQVVTREMSAK